MIALATLALAASARPALAQWTPPIGIPAPSFGIVENAPAVPNPWTVQVSGFYYVDATQPAATDSSNTFGTPGRPRQTIPTFLPGGSVVELHGTYDADHSSPRTIVAAGSALAPVYIRGASTAARPLIRNEWQVKGTYVILENLEFGPLDTITTGDLVMLAPVNHGVIRHSELHGNPNGGGMGVVSWDGSQNSNTVVWDVNIHDNGDLVSNFDQDTHGIAVSGYVDHLWVLDSQLVRNSGDGIQINAGQLQTTTHQIYDGRNTAYGNRQSGFWSKQAV